MAMFREYLSDGIPLDPERLGKERQNQLRTISELRGRDVMTYAASAKGGREGAINYNDLVPFRDQMIDAGGTQPTKGIDVILETGGGSGETVEDMVRLLRDRYESVAVIVPGMAKSAGTILAMGADEILMDGASSLGPIDAQLAGKYSAGALLDGFDKIKEEVLATKKLNMAYIPMLQNLSPGDLQHAKNALEFACELVERWLVQYKFKDWTTHSSTGRPVTDDERKETARRIALALHNHSKWKTHGRSIKMADLRALGLRITDYSREQPLCDAIRRYQVLLHITFQSNIFKLFETPRSVITMLAEQVGSTAPIQKIANQADVAQLQIKCRKCGVAFTIGARLAPAAKLPAGMMPFPANNLQKCPTPSCDVIHDLAPARQQIEHQSGKPLVL